MVSNKKEHNHKRRRSKVSNHMRRKEEKDFEREVYKKKDL